MYGFAIDGSEHAGVRASGQGRLLLVGVTVTGSSRTWDVSRSARTSKPWCKDCRYQPPEVHSVGDR